MYSLHLRKEIAHIKKTIVTFLMIVAYTEKSIGPNKREKTLSLINDVKKQFATNLWGIREFTSYRFQKKAVLNQKTAFLKSILQFDLYNFYEINLHAFLILLSNKITILFGNFICNFCA